MYPGHSWLVCFIDFIGGGELMLRYYVEQFVSYLLLYSGLSPEIFQKNRNWDILFPRLEETLVLGGEQLCSPINDHPLGLVFVKTPGSND